MSKETVANLLPLATGFLKLGIFNKVAVREETGFSDLNTGKPVEALTYYRSIRTSENKTVTQALHIFLQKNIKMVQAFAFVRSYPSKGVITMGHRWSNVTDNPNLFQLVAEESISFEELPMFISNGIQKAQEMFDITPKRETNKHFQETVNYLTSLYNNENSELEMMSVHISSTSLSFSIICESGWGNDYHFNLTKDGKSVAMKIDIDPREVGEGESSTYRTTEAIESSDKDSIYQAFTNLMKNYGILN